MKVYLCGGMHPRARVSWQDYVMREVPAHRYIDPRRWNGLTEAAYTRKELAAIDTCDMVFAYMEASNPSGYGLNLEIGYAKARGKRIVLVCDKLGHRKRYFGMARTCADARYATLEDAVLSELICVPRDVLGLPPKAKPGSIKRVI